MRAWLLAILLAGCASSGPLADEDSGAAEPVAWQNGQWWTYAIETNGATSEVTLVVAGERLLVSDPGPVMSSTADGFGFSGTYEGWTRTSHIVISTFGQSEESTVALNWLPETLKEGLSWDAGPLSGRVVSFDGTEAMLEYRSFPHTLHAVYSVEAGWFTHLQLPSETWTLKDSGTDYHGSLWRVESSSSSSDTLSTVLGSYDVGDSSLVRLTFDLSCADPGFLEFRLGHIHPVVDPVVAYQDVCPAAAHRVAWFELQYGDAAVESNGWTVNASLTDLGTMALDGIVVEPS